MDLEQLTKDIHSAYPHASVIPDLGRIAAIAAVSKNIAPS